MGSRTVALLLVVAVIGALVPNHSSAHQPANALKAPGPATAVTAPAAPLDTPVTLVSEGVTSYDLAVPKLFWYTRPSCIPTATRAPAADYAEIIRRIATYGSNTRTLYYETVNAVCPQQVLNVMSNIIADDAYVYWVSNSLNGIVRLSTDANAGDAPELLSGAVQDYAELAQDDDYVYTLSDAAGLVRINKTSGAASYHIANPGSSAYNFQTDGKYLYWISSGSLRRTTMDTTSVTTIASNVSGYYPEGNRLAGCVIGVGCFYSEYVFIGQGDEVVRYNNLGGSTIGPIYTSADGGASVYSLVTEDTGTLGSQLFLLESREVSCDMFCTYQNVLIRTGRASGTTPEALYTVTGMPSVSRTAEDLSTDNTFLFWKASGTLKRLPNDAEALPSINLTPNSLEITQGIQDVTNSVRLIENRRTFVRVYADSDGDPVPGVTAYLYRTNSVGSVIDGPLLPVNPVGQHITVPSWSNRTKLNDSFLFELPWSWTTGSLYLRVEVNPHWYPLEPNYEDNDLSAGPFTFQASPRLQVQFVSFGYVLDNQIYYPRLVDDVFQAYSWIRRAYPLASTPGSASDPSPGFRPNLWIVADDGLGEQVFVSPACTDAMKEDPATYPHCSNLRASAYTNSLMRAMRVENGIPNNVFMYGMTSDASGHFPRGQAGSGNVSSGPAGVYCCGSGSWDFDGSYADWYAAHEIGHTLNRGHPVPNADDPATKDQREGCGHSPDDPNYPYAFALISNGWAAGFDGGDPGLNPKLQMAVYPGIFWYDVMSYCPSLWISDYTYNAMYDRMMVATSREPDPNSPAAPRIEGDFLSLFGEITPDNDTATIHRLRRLSSVASIPDLFAGDVDYRIRLLGSGDAVLADYAFTPEAVYNTDHTALSFGQVVTFTSGAVQVQIVKGAANQVLASQSISPNPPLVSAVALQSPPNPVTGTVTLGWSASDPDGDDLRFDILYSSDGGASFQPLQMGVSGSGAQIDAAPLGGSSNAILRVTANDGANTASGDTDPFIMASKPPQPRILAPADGTQIHYGQLVNFSGEALDAQDGSVDGGNLAWSNQHGALGSGALLSVDDLPVGVNHITLSATNSDGLSAQATISVTVDDDLNLPGPTLSVGPDRIAWHVSAGSTQAQSADLGIGNAGSGDLSWTASEDASWLELSASGGTVPFSLTLTADPSGLAGGTALSTTLWITAPASSNHVTETLAIPVGLSVGDVYRVYEGVPGYPVYLPLMLRGQ